MEVRADLLGGNDSNGGRQERVAGALTLRRGQLRTRLEMRDLPQRVHSRIGASRAVNRENLLGEDSQNLHERTLIRGTADLNVPAGKIRSIVGQRQLDDVPFRVILSNSSDFLARMPSTAFPQ